MLKLTLKLCIIYLHNLSIKNSFWDFFCSLTISFDEAMSGVACNLESHGFHVLSKATEEVVGYVKPYSITGSLPLIRELQVISLSLFNDLLDLVFL